MVFLHFGKAGWSQQHTGSAGGELVAGVSVFWPEIPPTESFTNYTVVWMSLCSAPYSIGRLPELAVSVSTF